MPLSDLERAEKSAAAMWETDAAAKWVGMNLLTVSKGAASMEMQVQPHHCNGHGICHGGMIFALADTAFAYACNSYNETTVAQHNTISFVAPGQVGDTLTATATEISKSGRSGIYDVNVTDSTGGLIATFRGCSRSIKGQNFPE